MEGNKQYENARQGKKFNKSDGSLMRKGGKRTIN
jgi:hypothetical protein